MTVREIISKTSHTLSDQIDPDVLLSWFNDIELMVQMQLLGRSRADAVQYKRETRDAQPIIRGRYARVYSYWLLARGYARLKNASGYEHYRKLYISEYEALRKWFLCTHESPTPANGLRDVFLSAYAIALKDGKGGTGMQYDMDYDAESHTLRLLCNGVVQRSFVLLPGKAG